MVSGVLVKRPTSQPRIGYSSTIPATHQAMQEATAANQAQQAQETEQDQSQPEADLSDTAEFSPVSAQPQPEEQAQEEDVPTARRDGRIDFGSLQFGRDYEIK